MIDYCTNQWMILNYPAGAGGKFIGNCLFLFDKVAHWHNIHGQQETVDYFQKNMSKPDLLWTSRELNHYWDINFFSRCYPRNNNLTSIEFNQLVDRHSSSYFKQCWNQHSVIVDFWCKPVFPEFWQKTHSITIVLDDIEIYKNLVLSKLYKIDWQKNTITSILDSPMVSTNDNKKNVQLYNNEYEFELIDLDTFFETNVKQKPWLNPWLDSPIRNDQFTIQISELINCKAFVDKFQWFEELYQQKISTKYLVQMHDIWSRANEQQQKQLSCA
jgi:hypothetical protein